MKCLILFSGQNMKKYSKILSVENFNMSGCFENLILDGLPNRTTLVKFSRHQNDDIFLIFYAPKFEEVEGAYWFGLSICPRYTCIR